LALYAPLVPYLSLEQASSREIFTRHVETLSSGIDSFFRQGKILNFVSDLLQPVRLHMMLNTGEVYIGMSCFLGMHISSRWNKHC